jgi:hypothetical protein
MEAANDSVVLRLPPLECPEAHAHVEDVQSELDRGQLSAVGEFWLRVPASVPLNLILKHISSSPAYNQGLCKLQS